MPKNENVPRNENEQKSMQPKKREETLKINPNCYKQLRRNCSDCKLRCPLNNASLPF